MAELGSVHHLELWVEDLAVAEREWGWLLGRLGYECGDRWSDGQSWRRGETYVVLEASPARVPGGHDRLRAGLNHVAFHACTVEDVEAVVAEAPRHGWALMFADRHPHAGGEHQHAAYLENTAGFEVELVADDVETVLIPVRDGRIADGGSWVYVWIATHDHRVVYVGGTGISPRLRTWLHLNDPDPDVGRVAARYPASAVEPLDVLALRLPDNVPRPTAKAALVRGLAEAGLLADGYVGDAPAPGDVVVEASVSARVERFVDLVRAHR